MTVPDPSHEGNATPSQPGSTPSFGRFQLLRLLGKSTRTLVWLAIDPKSDQECMLVMPRHQSGDRARLEQHLQASRRALRVTHPALAAPVEVGEHDRWPYAAYERGQSVTLAEAMKRQGLPPAEAAQMSAQVLDGLAFAHEAGLAHRDIQAVMVLVEEGGRARLMGLEVAPVAVENAAALGDSALSATGLQAQRRDAERDVLCFGLVLHYALTGQHPLDEPDTACVIARMPPAGREILRLPWNTAQPIPEPLRVIANRATDRQERQRYHSARTLARALEGWIKSDSQSDGGPLALLLDRLRSNGPLPSLPGASRRAARLALMERERTIELAEVVMQDPALTFELLRAVNTAQVRGAMVSGSGPVLTLRRAVALLGLDGVRRVALSLRDWPGPLSEPAAEQLSGVIERVQRAARLAQMLRPSGYDAEVVYLITLLQNLGRLVTWYHFPEEAAQIQRLMQPIPAESAGAEAEPGMSEEAAAFAVLGIDIESLGNAVARYWGLDETVLHMIRRFAAGAAVRSVESDDDLLRATASCANEVVDVLGRPSAQVQAALLGVAQRYARALNLSLRDLELAAHGQSPHGAEPVPGQPQGARRRQPAGALPS